MQRFAYPMIIAIGLAVCGTGTACGEESQPLLVESLEPMERLHTA